MGKRCGMYCAGLKNVRVGTMSENRSSDGAGCAAACLESIHLCCQGISPRRHGRGVNKGVQAGVCMLLSTDSGNRSAQR